MHTVGQTSLTVFSGPMFSGKSGRLISAVTKFTYTRSVIKIAKPYKDTRIDAFIASRQLDGDGNSIIASRLPATTIQTEEEFLKFTEGDDYSVLAIDEVHLFDDWLIRAIRDLTHRRRKDQLQILCAGLDTDSDDWPFHVTAYLLALAEIPEKDTAICMHCQTMPASKSYRVDRKPAKISIGDNESYEARCRSCFEPAI